LVHIPWLAYVYILCIESCAGASLALSRTDLTQGRLRLSRQLLMEQRVNADERTQET